MFVDGKFFFVSVPTLRCEHHQVGRSVLDQVDRIGANPNPGRVESNIVIRLTSFIFLEFRIWNPESCLIRIDSEFCLSRIYFESDLR